MTKAEIIDALEAKGIGYDPTASKADLEALLPAETAPEAAPEVTAAPEPVSVPEAPPVPAQDYGGITVEDAEILKPVEKPLVVKPPASGWKNDAQAEYAKTLNGYAYKNGKKWTKKKDVLIKRLIEIGEDPEALQKYKGNDSNLKYGNKLIEGNSLGD